MYLDDLNRAAEITKLQNRYLQMINDTTDTNIQQQITNQMKTQLEMLRAKEKLSEYDVKYANAQLEILQKTIALEDARNAKNSMKLRRDSQGNYNYVYTADEDDITEKENDLLDAQMNAYNMSVEERVNAQDRYLQKIQTMADQLRQVANDDNLTKERIAAITADIIAQGYEFLASSSEQLSTAQKNAVQSFIDAAELMSEENAKNVKEIVKNLDAKTGESADLMTDLMTEIVNRFEQGSEGIKIMSDDLHDSLVKNVGSFETVISDLNENIEYPLNDIDNQFSKVNDTLQSLIASAEDFYSILEDKSGIVAGAASKIAVYQTALTDAGNQMSAYRDSVINMQNQLEAYAAENANLNTQLRAALKAKKKAEKEAAEAYEKGKKDAKKGSSSSSSSDEVDEDVA